MIPASFDYLRPSSIDEAVAALGEHGDDAKLLAGGHSLLPLMKLRLAAPEVVIDLARVDGLRGVSEVGDGRLAIGAMTPHFKVMEDPLIREHCGVLADVTAKVGDAQVRHRGTIGGALAHGDSAGDLPAVLLALGGSVIAQGPGGTREIEAEDFFVDYLTTALSDDELLTEVRVPKLVGDWGWRYEKFSRVAQAWAIVGALGMVKRSNGHIEDARVGLTNMGTRPVRCTATEDAIRGQSRDAIGDAAAHASDGTSPSSDLNATAEFRQHLARVLTKRALTAAAG
jgi:aerobic carbon-monoxide dehydrogenase medium subunit